MTKTARCLGMAALLLALAACSHPKTQGVDQPTTGATVTQLPASTSTPKRPTTGKRAPAATPDKPFVPKAPGVRISRVAVPGPYVALTFDDGPHASYTPQILDILKRHGAHATFFVLGSNAARHPGILARAVAEGNEIGSHTWSHINMSRSSQETICRELDRTGAAIEQAIGKKPSVMRPPYGACNSRVTSLVYNSYGTPAILWDVDTQDWRHPGVDTVISRAVGRARSGSIILVHDIHASTLAAVEGIVTGLQARGFKLVTVSQLIAMGRRAAGASAPAPLPATTPSAETLPATDAPPAAEPGPTPVAPLPEAGTGAASIGTAPDAEPAATDAGTTPQAQPEPAPVGGDTPLPQGQFFQPFTTQS